MARIEIAEGDTIFAIQKSCLRKERCIHANPQNRTEKESMQTLRNEAYSDVSHIACPILDNGKDVAQLSCGLCREFLSKR